MCRGMVIESLVFAAGLFALSRALGPFVSDVASRLSAGAQGKALGQIVTFVGAGIYEEVLFRHLSRWVEDRRPGRDPARIERAARFSVDTNVTLARLAHHQPARLVGLAAGFVRLGPPGWRRYVRGSRNGSGPRKWRRKNLISSFDTCPSGSNGASRASR